MLCRGIYTTSQKFLNSKIFYVFFLILFCSPSMHLLYIHCEHVQLSASFHFFIIVSFHPYDILALIYGLGLSFNLFYCASGKTSDN